MRLIYGTVQGDGFARSFAEEILGASAGDYLASHALQVDARTLGGLSELDFQRPESVPIKLVEGVVADIQDMSDYGEDFSYVDIALADGKTRTIILRGSAEYYAVGARLIVRLIEHGPTFAHGNRYNHTVDIWSDLDEAERPLVG